MERKFFGIAGVLLLIVLGLAMHWQPERQIRRHQRALLSALEARNWGRFAALVAETYSDQWQHDKSFLLETPREVFGQFLFLTIQERDLMVSQADGSGTVTSGLIISGKGGPLAELAKTRVNTLREPFRFRWEKQGWKPWAWQLVRVEQSELDLAPF